MASTITLDTGQNGRGVAGDKFIRRGSGNLGIYATGGVAITPAQFELAVALRDLDIGSPAGYFFEWDQANAKIKAYGDVKIFTATFDPASLAGVTSRDDAITFTGVLATDQVLAVIPPAAILASVVVQNARVTGADTITARLTNPSAGAVDVLTGTWTAIVVGANGQGKEIANAVDLSAVTFRFRAEGN